MKKLQILILFFVAIFLLPIKVLAQFDIPEKPSFQTSLYDYANVLSSSEKQLLENKLVRYSDTTSTQIVIVTVNDLKGESAERVAPEWAQKWGVGQAKEDNGIFVLVNVGGHNMYIATGYGVQGRLPAGTVGTIIRQYITPEFKKGDYYAGLDEGTDAIFQSLNGKFKGERKSKDGFPGGLIFIILLIIFFIIVRSSRGGGRGGRGGGGGLDLTDILILSSLGRGHNRGGWSGGSSGGGWSGGGSGGFGGGFGGGGFSGGGAGGSW